MLSSIKRKPIFTVLILAVILITTGAYLSYSMLYNKGNNIKRFSGSACHAIFSSEGLIEIADVIIIGRPMKDLVDQTPTINYYGSVISSYYTERDIEIEKVLKGDYQDKTISVLESAAVIDNPNTKEKELFIDREYSEMQKGKRYILFAKKIPDGRYSLIAVNQGKFNIDSKDSKEKEIQDDKDKQFYDLKIDILAKFKDKFN